MTKLSRFILYIVFLLISLLLAGRLALPHILHRYVENRLNEIPEYKASIGDIDVHLYRGSYTIKDVDLKKVTGRIPVPFFSAKAVDLQIEWRALLRGDFVGQMSIKQPELNFVTDPKGQNEQLTIDKQWQDAVKALFPLNLNKVEIYNGEVHYRSFAGDSPFDIYLKEVNAEVDNLQKVKKEEERLSSHIKVRAQGMDGSPVRLDMDLDPFAKQPAFKLNASIENMQIPVANDFLRHYSKLDIRQGYFSAYIEVATAKGKITGYIKPLIKDLEVMDPKEKNPIKALYKGAVQTVSRILENPQQKTVATKIPVKGDIQDPDTSIWAIIGNLLRHAFVQAFLPQIDHSVEMRDIDLKF